MDGISRKKYSVFSLILTAIGAVALLLQGGSVPKLLTGCAYVLLGSLLFGARFLPTERGVGRVLVGGIVFLSALMIAGSAVYYAGNLGIMATGLVVIGTPLLSLAFPSRRADGKELLSHREETVSAGAPNPSWIAKIAGFAMLVAYAGVLWYAFTLIAGAATDATIRTPWDMVPSAVFTLVFLAALGLFAFIFSGAMGRAAVLPMMLLMGTLTGVAVLVYAIGYGFDPFIHRATEAVIFRDGMISPKPLYYVGQYALVVLFARLTGLGTGAIDLALVPCFAMLLIPVAFWSLRRAFRWDAPLALTACFGLFLLPLSPFIATTPQGFANVLLLMAAFLALVSIHEPAVFPKPLLVLLGIATALVHPLAGIPVLLFIAVIVVVTMIEGRQGWTLHVRRWALITLAVGGCLALPAVFMLNSSVSDAAVHLDTEALKSPAALIQDLRTVPDIATRQYRALLDVTYAWRTWRTPLLLLAGLIGIAFLRRRRDAAEIYAISAFIFLGNYVLLKSFIDFPFLIAYEQSNYADRLLDLTVFLLAPAATIAFAHVLAKVRTGMPSLRIGTAVLVGMLVTSSFYLAYPRRDTYESSRGWSTSAQDVAAVHRIDEEADGKPYVVLADQSVSAAAIRELGFKQYFGDRGDIFFYPIPTGGPLYAQFLAMNECDGCKATALAAMDLAGVDQAFFVVNHYWFGAQGIIVGAQKDAAESWVIDDRDWVFRYVRK
jgi:hypothetical protein